MVSRCISAPAAGSIQMKCMRAHHKVTAADVLLACLFPKQSPTSTTTVFTGSYFGSSHADISSAVGV